LIKVILISGLAHSSILNLSMMKADFNIQPIPSQETWEWLLKKHYAHRIPSISYAFGLYENNVLCGVCTFGTPSSAPLREGIAGKSYINNVIELNRLVVESRELNITSWFVSRCLKSFKYKIVISYADTEQGHVGKIYQACNFLYTGLSAKRTDWKVNGMEHLHGQTIADESRGAEDRVQYMIDKYGDDFYLQDRPRKHRYIYICGDKKFKRDALKSLKYPILEYPKGETKRYDASYKPIVQGILI
jgi:hypothetical protein